MSHAETKKFRPPILAAIAGLLVVSVFASGQVAPKQAPQPPASNDIQKYPGLMEEFGHIVDRFTHEIETPRNRYESNLLQLLPASTTYYVAFPNFGEVIHQALAIFHEELNTSAVLRKWWQDQNAASNGGAHYEDQLQKLYEISQYIGDEVVLSGEMREPHPEFLALAEVRKAGFKNFLEQTLQALPEAAKSSVLVLDPQSLLTASSVKKTPEAVVLVRPDFVIASSNLETVRKFNEQLETKSGTFASTPFGQRLTKAYQGGATVVGAADLQKILSQIPAGTKANQQALERSGFKDVQYFVWTSTHNGDRRVSEMELSFTGPRHGAASWLAAPGRLGSLDFVSPKSIFVGSLRLKNFADMFDDIRDMSKISDPNAFASLLQMEQAMRVNLRDDLLSKFQGEVTFEVPQFQPTVPVWNVILRVNDGDSLQKTLDRLMLNMGMQPAEFEADGVTYYSISLPSRGKPQEIVYSFVDDYLIVSGSRKSATDAVRLHVSGESLAKSPKLSASLPPGYSADVSALLYEDFSKMLQLQFQELAPKVMNASYSSPAEVAPVILRGYGEESAIRGVSTGTGADVSAFMIGAAIAIPNLMRARASANEATAIGTLRTAVTAEVTYSATYPQKGYARDFATLGTGPHGRADLSANHAGLIDHTLGRPECKTGAWCTKTGYRFSLAGCDQKQRCYVVVATPVSLSEGTRSFCATADGVIRFKFAGMLNSPISASECQKWQPVQ